MILHPQQPGHPDAHPQPDAEIAAGWSPAALGGFLWADVPGLANLEISLDADLLHALWMGTESTHLAFFSGQIETRGNLLKALQLAEIFTAAERIYPTIARQYGLRQMHERHRRARTVAADCFDTPIEQPL